jgi:hypothetical protein
MSAARFLLLASRARLVKEPLPGVLAVAGRSVLAFREPDTVGDYSFLGRPSWIARKEGNPSLWWNEGRGVRLAEWPRSCPRLQAPEINPRFFNGLIECLHRRVKTGFRFSSLWRRMACLVRTSTPRAVWFGRAGFSMSSCPACLEAVVLRSGFGRDDGCNRRSRFKARRPPTGESLLWKERQKRTRLGR